MREGKGSKGGPGRKISSEKRGQDFRGEQSEGGDLVAVEGTVGSLREISQQKKRKGAFRKSQGFVINLGSRAVEKRS